MLKTCFMKSFYGLEQNSIQLNTAKHSDNTLHLIINYNESLALVSDFSASL